jgi:hypothetical protein
MVLIERPGKSHHVIPSDVIADLRLAYRSENDLRFLHHGQRLIVIGLSTARAVTKSTAFPEKSAKKSAACEVVRVSYMTPS